MRICRKSRCPICRRFDARIKTTEHPAPARISQPCPLRVCFLFCPSYKCRDNLPWLSFVFLWFSLFGRTGTGACPYARRKRGALPPNSAQNNHPASEFERRPPVWENKSETAPRGRRKGEMECWVMGRSSGSCGACSFRRPAFWCNACSSTWASTPCGRRTI